jgi:hypothetical protein
VKSRRNTFAIILTLAAVVVPISVRAQDATAVRYQTIRDRCQSLHLLLDELQRRDLVSRTNLGREYENVARLFSAFNQRVKNNNLNAQQFEQLTSDFNSASAQFRSAYVQYDDGLIALQQIDCKDKPADFDTQLGKTRELRDITEGAATHANAIAGQYRTQMVQLQAELPPAKGSN